ncbi:MULTISPECIES: NAD(P)H-dependent oxidoreductase [unclassified Jeotgalibaca]|uniref:NAD(P)H-dependent oxidoreductase n=1 Tax=unclassified Jeotgalibaca TaxID=2621505 RepID=UPI003FCF9335
MKTLVIVSHPELRESHTQRFLWESLPTENITWHHLEEKYPDGIIDVNQEQNLLKAHDRIVFQFPLYWYSSPPLLKKWQDSVLTEGFAYGRYGSQLASKELLLVIATGVPEKAYQPGESEDFTLPELLRPFQAMATKCELVYLPVFVISQFDYMSESERRKLLIRYRQALTGPAKMTLEEREMWFERELLILGKEMLPAEDRTLVDLLIDQMQTNREYLNDLNWTLQEMKE